MRVQCILAAIFASAHVSKVSAQLSSSGQSDLSTDGDTGPTFTYTPSNSNTKPPKLFSDPVIPDNAYHELVPALEALEDLVTTTPGPGHQF